jgi:hypothetical protein
MDSGEDPVQRSAAAAAINTVQLVSAAFGAGLAGVAALAGCTPSSRWWRPPVSWLRIARSATSGDLVHVVLGMEDGDNPIDGGESVWRLSHLSAR